MSAPEQQVMLDNTRLRPILVPRTNQSAGTLLHTSYAHKDFGKLVCFRTICSGNFMMCGCMETVQKALAASTYVKVYDNKIEFNEPMNMAVPYVTPGLCNVCNWACLQGDNITTLHYDRALMANAVVAQDWCQPCGTHSDPCPNGCGPWRAGESVVLYANVAKCRCCDLRCTPMFQCFQTKSINQYTATGGSVFDQYTAAYGTGCCPPHRMIRGVDNAAALANSINKARNDSGIPAIVLGIAQEDVWKGVDVPANSNPQ